MDDIIKMDDTIDKHGNSIIILRQQLEQRFPFHTHKKGQLLLVYGGIAYLKTQQKDYYIPANHYVWIPQGYIHSLMFNSNDLQIINIYFPVTDKIVDYDFYRELGIYPVSKLVSEMLGFSNKWYGDYFPNSWQFGFLLSLKHLLPNENLRKFSIQLPTTDDPRLSRIVEFIANNIQEPLTLQVIADNFAISVRSTIRLFNEKLHISFIQYLRMLRIIYAMELIKNSDMSISEVAYTVGYSSISAFSTTFLQLTNLRPTEFKSII